MVRAGRPGTGQRPGPDQPRRRVILHYHIFKNAGSTIDFILARNFGHRLGFYEGLEP